LFKFHAYLFDYLLTLRDIGLRILAGEALASTPDCKSFIIEETSDLTDNQNVLTLIIAAIASSLYRL